MYSLGASVEVFVSESNVLQGLFVQDVYMRDVYSAYPEFLCLDELLELRLPLYIMLVEDGNGSSEVVAALLMEESEINMTKVIEVFKKYNPAWESTRVIMTDKDLTERDVLAKSFPNATLLICLFHTFRSFRREITIDKMGITSCQRNSCLEMLQKMAYSTSEDNYMSLYQHFLASSPVQVTEYFNENWHQIRHQWALGMKYASGNFLNGTNN